MYSDSIEYKSSFYSTYGWHPLSVEVSLVTIKYILKHKNKLLNHIAEMSEYFRERLSRMAFKHAAEIRVKGLAISVDFKFGDYSNQICSEALEQGLLLSELSESMFSILPALTIEKEVAEKGLDILEACCDSLQAKAA